MIDIFVTPPEPVVKPEKPSKTSKPNWTAVVLGLLLAFVVYDTNYLGKFFPDRDGDKVIVESKLSTILFVVDGSQSRGQGQVTISQKLARFLQDNNIERRRLEAGQDTSSAEPWLQEMAQIGYGQAPCVVFRSRDGSLDLIKIPNDLESMIQEVEDRI